MAASRRFGVRGTAVCARGGESAVCGRESMACGRESMACGRESAAWARDRNSRINAIRAQKREHSVFLCA
ncbi:hypothetical protein, partial [Microbacterium testaceum]|uniref:hypothetical protein n=1 Tax=Microbacterium testaceum TaxID=2033 RepID=UPI0019D35AC5